jgi:pyrroline-5-carboxylate reductase
MKLGLVGCGFMGEAIISSVLKQKLADPGEIRVAEINGDRCAAVDKTYGVSASTDIGPAVDGAEIVFFAVKPQEFDAAAHHLQGRFHRDQTIVSIMAGVPIDRIARAVTHAAIVRAMPNTPAVVGEGMTLWTATPEVDEGTRGQVGSILRAMGREVFVEDEKYLDMATALSGSGPGFVFMLLEAFVDAGVHVGFKRPVAEMLALQTFIGSAKYAEATGKHLAQLRNEVTSPGGTTAAGLQALENAGVRGAIIDAIEAAYERSKELGA